MILKIQPQSQFRETFYILIAPPKRKMRFRKRNLVRKNTIIRLKYTWGWTVTIKFKNILYTVEREKERKSSIYRIFPCFYFHIDYNVT